MLNSKIKNILWDNATEVTTLSVGKGISIIDDGNGTPVISCTIASGDSNTITIGGTDENPTLDLNTLSETDQEYTNASITVDKFGRITSGKNGDIPLTNIVSTDGYITISSSSPGQDQLTLNTELQGLAANTIKGLITKTDTGKYTACSIQVGTNNNLTITNGDGISGNPTIDLTTSPIVDKITIKNLPITNTDAVNKQYTDALIAGLAFKDPCVAASTTNITAAYDNGTNGVGATLTANIIGNNLSFDGYTPSIGDRLLIKDQIDEIQNGIYTLTTIGEDDNLPWILTRTFDYDNVPEVKAGNMIAVTKGIVNANTIWLESSIVIAIGIDNISFTQFSYGPSSFFQRSNNLAEITDKSAAIANLGLEKTVLSNFQNTSSLGYIPFFNNNTGTELIDNYQGASISSNNNGDLNINSSGDIILTGSRLITNIYPFFQRGIYLYGSNDPNISVSLFANPIDTYSIVFPETSPQDNQIMISDSLGNLSWIDKPIPGIISLSGTSSEINVTGTSQAPIIGLTDTAVTPNTYTNATIKVDSKGRITTASNGADLTSFMQKSNNLSDLANTSAAVTNLGLSRAVKSNSINTNVKGRVLFANSDDGTDLSYSGYGSAYIFSSSSTGALVMGASGGIFMNTNTTFPNPAIFINSSIIFKNNLTSPSISLSCPANINNTYTLTLPTTAPTNNQIMMSDSSGNLSWINLPSGVTSVNSASPSNIKVAGTESSPTIDLAIAGLGAATYNYPKSISVDNYGRITSASSGNASGKNTVVYISSTTPKQWIVPTGINTAKVTIIGGGGGGSGTYGSNQVGQSGGSGASLIATLTNLASSTVNLTIGSGGTSGVNAGSSSLTWTDTTGKTTTLTAPGGNSGLNYASTYYNGAAGAQPPTNSGGSNILSFLGFPGQWGGGSANLSECYILGAGGNSILGGGAAQQAVGTANGFSATQNTGSGGGSGGGPLSGSGANGGTGANGIIIIEY